ncbi:MAG TPA: Ig-like domain-containing protein [Longimicrobiales bacterium]|nr:Ig-like domain-containing protein [Longimicrobiales bacterium]
MRQRMAHSTARRRAGGLALAAVVVLAAACDGNNAFSGPVGLQQDVPRVEITIPRGDSTALPLQDSVFVEARFRDNIGIEKVVFYGETVRGDPNVGTDVRFPRFTAREVELSGVRDTIVARFLLPVEDTIKEFTNIIAQGFDRDGNMGADTVRVQLGGPGVRILGPQNGQTVQAGLTLNISALAKDPETISSMDFYLQGSVNATLRRTFNPPTDSIVVDTTVAIPADAEGPFTLTVRATNTLGLTGGDGPITVNVIQESTAVDTTAPRLTLTASPRDRVELGDSIPIQITGSDDVAGVGVASVGYTVRVTSPTGPDTVVRQVAAPYVPPRTGSISRQFGIPIIGVDSLSLPDTLVYEVTAWMVDGNGNCGAAVDDGITFPCSALPTGERIALDQDGLRFTLIVVAGRTVLLPNGGKILDARVDTTRRNLFLSNVSRGRVEVFRLDQEQFGTAIGVGSNPWGMAFSRNGDSLWVANSGGTNFSVVDLNTEVEVENQRLLTPDVVLFDVKLDETTGEYVVFPLPQAGEAAFSDRPQFMAVDSFGNVIYSTTTTATGALGTARKAYYPQPADQSEVKLFVEHGQTDEAQQFWALAHIDSIGTAVDSVPDGNGGMMPVAELTLFDHVPGFPDQVITGGAGQGENPSTAWAELVSQGSDSYIVPGARWNVETVGFSDTTYVDASGDGGWVAVGEGATQGLGRVLMYEASPNDITALSGIIPVSDFLTNASEEVRGVGVNYDGTLVGARGDFAYFFDTDLRPFGQGNIPNAGQAQGIAFHPLHANFRTLTNLTNGVYIPDVHMAFVGSGNRTIDILDTQRGGDPIGRVTIRDVITGPLRAILPFPADNAGRTCSTIPITDRRGNFVGNAIQLYTGQNFNTPIAPDGITEDACVVVKLFGATSSGGVVVVPVTKADILRNHPVRLGG